MKTDKMTLDKLKIDKENMRKNRLLLLPLAFMLVLATVIMACSSDEHDRVRKAAEKSYSYLLKGKYEKFVGEIAYADSMSEDYRAQMVDLVHEYTATLNRQHGSFVSISAVDDTICGNQAHVFLQVVFADSVSEEIGVPMVKVNEEWKMQ